MGEMILLSMEELAQKIALVLTKSPHDYNWDQLILRWGNGIRAHGGTPDTAQMRALTISLASTTRAGPPTTKAVLSCLMLFTRSLGSTYDSLYQAF